MPTHRKMTYKSQEFKICNVNNKIQKISVQRKPNNRYVYSLGLSFAALKTVKKFPAVYPIHLKVQIDNFKRQPRFLN